MFRSAVLLLFSSATIPSRCQIVLGGTATAVAVSHDGTLVAVAADSRQTGGPSGPDDKACKIIALGSRTVFLSSGSARLQTKFRGAVVRSFTANEVAGRSFNTSKSKNVRSISDKWSQIAQIEIGEFDRDFLINIQNKRSGKYLVSGCFAGSTATAVVAQCNYVFFNESTNKVDVRVDPIRPDDPIYQGVGFDAVEEFRDGKTPRSQEARKDCCSTSSISSPEFAEGLVDFVIRFSTGQDHDEVHGPVDVAILRRGSQVEWKKRKPNCSAEDYK